MEAKSKDLERVVEEMTQEFVGLSDALVVGGIATESVMGPLLKNALTRFLELGKRAAKEPGGTEEVGDSEDEESDGNETVRGESMSSEVLTGDWSLPIDMMVDGDNSFEFPMPEDNFQNPFLSEPDHTNLPTFNPYTNNLWQTPPSNSLAVACASIVPYILAGRDSFASRLYFETISLAVQSLRGDLPYHFAQAMFRFKLQHATRTQLFGKLASVLDTLLQGTTNVADGAVDYGKLEDVQKKIIQEIEQKGARKEEFLSTWEVEKYLKRRWRLGLDSRMVRVQPTAMQHTSAGADSSSIMSLFAPTIIPGFQEKEQVIMSAGPLVERLKPAAMTIGEGPRWHLGDIDSIVQTFLKGNNWGGSTEPAF